MLITKTFYAKIVRPSWSFPRFILLLVSSHLAIGQAPPNADIFLVDLDLKSQPAQVGSPTNITQRIGYDNQPSFSPDGAGLLYTSMRDDGQTDIYRYDVKQKSTTQLTRTPESEYSPTITPDKTYFSVIRVEKDQIQRLWKFPVSGNGEPELVLKNVKPVGYHCWLSNDWLALFILGKPNSLQLAQTTTGDTVRIEGNIGRALQNVPGKNAVSFVHKRTPTDWEIKQLDLQTRQSSLIVKTLEGSEDFVWTPDGTLLMCRGSVLYHYKPNVTPNWTQLADFSSFGIKQLNRLAIDPQGKKLALVGQ
jgi:dipeptidyl aminopeptidase/acylaminoacyl peptidase